MRAALFIALLFINSSCAYHWGFRDRNLPGGYKHVAVPVFKNESGEPGLETDYTSALIRRFERSQVAHIASRSVAPVRIDGIIKDVRISAAGGGVVGNQAGLPADASLQNGYLLVVAAHVSVIRQSDEKVLWQGDFTGQRAYQAPHVLEPVVNSADATYNASARRRTLAELADEMMLDVHDRITENF